jgi:hypothetical protein
MQSHAFATGDVSRPPLPIRLSSRIRLAQATSVGHEPVAQCARVHRSPVPFFCVAGMGAGDQAGRSAAPRIDDNQVPPRPRTLDPVLAENPGQAAARLRVEVMTRLDWCGPAFWFCSNTSVAFKRLDSSAVDATVGRKIGCVPERDARCEGCRSRREVHLCIRHFAFLAVSSGP